MKMKSKKMPNKKNVNFSSVKTEKKQVGKFNKPPKAKKLSVYDDLEGDDFDDYDDFDDLDDYNEYDDL